MSSAPKMVKAKGGTVELLMKPLWREVYRRAGPLQLHRDYSEARALFRVQGLQVPCTYTARSRCVTGC